METSDKHVESVELGSQDIEDILGMLDVPVRDTEEKEKIRVESELKTRFMDTIIATKQFTDMLDKLAGDLEAKSENVLLKRRHEELDETNKYDPGQPIDSWDKHSMRSTSVPQEAAHQMYDFYKKWSEVETLFNEHKYTFAQILPSTVNGYTIETIFVPFKYGRTILLEYLAERYDALVGEEEDCKVKDEEDEEISCNAISKEIHQKYVRETKDYITRTETGTILKLTEVIPSNARLMFSNIFMTYWRLASYVVALYTGISVEDSTYLFKYVNKVIVLLLDPKVIFRPKWIGLLTHPIKLRKSYFELLFPQSDIVTVADYLGYRESE